MMASAVSSTRKATLPRASTPTRRTRAPAADGGSGVEALIPKNTKIREGGGEGKGEQERGKGNLCARRTLHEGRDVRAHTVSARHRGMCAESREPSWRLYQNATSAGIRGNQCGAVCHPAPRSDGARARVGVTESGLEARCPALCAGALRVCDVPALHSRPYCAPERSP